MGIFRRAERQIATDDPKHANERHRRDRGAEHADDEVDRRVGGDTCIITDAALGILMVTRHQIELVVVAVCNHLPTRSSVNHLRHSR